MPSSSTADDDVDPFAGSSRGPLNPVASPSGWSAKGIALQVAATASTIAYLKLRYETTFAADSKSSSSPPPSCSAASAVAALLLAAEALAAFRALCHLGPFNLRSREQYVDTEDLLEANSYEGCHMRVLIPCYSESLELVSATAIAAAAADLPRGMARTIYLCDDGADPLKKKWCEDCHRDRTLGCDVRWVSGRSKAVPGNGKSLNLNYALRSIYGERAVAANCGRGAASPGWRAAVPDTEFVAGLDADMAPSPTYFTELASKLRAPRDAIAQSAQAFWNYDAEADVADNAQLVKYEVCDSQVRAGGGVRCNGSGWVCRARAMAHAGWWRVDTTGEGQAMGIALERLGYKGYYSMKTLQVGEVPCTLGDTFVQKTRYAQNFWKNVFCRNGILYDRTLSPGKRLTGQGLLRDSLTPIYVPIMVLAPVLALLCPCCFPASSSSSSSASTMASKIVGWSPGLPWAWLLQYFLLQSVVLFHVAGAALGPRKQRRQKACVRSLPASWLTNLTSTHAFWLATAVAAYKVFRAEVRGSLLEFVVTPKTQSAREEPAAAAAGAAADAAAASVATSAPGGPLAAALSSASAPTVAALPGVAASIAARPSLYPDEYFADGRRKSVLLPAATAAAAGLARRASAALAGAASGFGGGIERAATTTAAGARPTLATMGGRTAAGPRMRQASMQRCRSLARVMRLHVEGGQAAKKNKGASPAAAAPAAAPSAAAAIKTPFRVASLFKAGDAKAKAAAAAAAESSSSDDDGDGDDDKNKSARRVGFAPGTAADAAAAGKESPVSRPPGSAFSGGGRSGEWRQLLASRRRDALRDNAKKLRRWTSSLRVVRKQNHSSTAGVDGAVEDGATAFDEEEREAVPWEHLWVHALGGGLSLLAFASGVARVLLGLVAKRATPSSSSSSFFSRKPAAASPSSALPAPQLLVFTAWAFVNAVPPALLFVRTLKGDGPTLKRWCSVAPRAVFAVGGLALAGALAASSA